MHMPYADTDFFIALIRDDDRLRLSASSIYSKYKGTIWTSLAVVLELLIVAKRFNLEAKRVIRDLLLIAVVEGVDSSTILLAVRYIDEQKLSIFDAFHAALCRNEIISSDHAYDKLGIKRIAL